MPHIPAYWSGESPLPATRSKRDPRLSQQRYAVGYRTDPSRLDAARDFAWLTEHTSHTVLGPRLAERLGLVDGDAFQVWLTDDDVRICGPITLEVRVSTSDDVEPFALELGWDVVERDFEIGPEGPDRIRILTARDDEMCSVGIP
jgi:hypothetical protein